MDLGYTPERYKGFNPGDILAIPQEKITSNSTRKNLFRYKGHANCFPDDWENRQKLLVVEDCWPIFPHGVERGEIYIPVPKLQVEVPTNRFTNKKFRTLEMDMDKIETIGNIPHILWLRLGEGCLAEFQKMQFRKDQKIKKGTSVYDLLTSYYQHLSNIE